MSLLTLPLALSHFILTVRCQEQSTNTLSVPQRWGYGILAGFGLSLIGFLAALFIQLLDCCGNSQFSQKVLKFFVAYAAGAMIGDALIHILPQMFKQTELNATISSLIVLCGILSMLLFHKILHLLGLDSGHSHAKHESIKVEPHNPNPQPDVLSQSVDEGQKSNCSCQVLQLSDKGAAGYMNLLGSLIHNMIDGLILGVAFSTGQVSKIIPTVIAIFAHQIPRQISDLAVLLTNRFSKWQSILYNGLINFLSLIGVVIGLALSKTNKQSQMYVLGFVAGNFLYVGSQLYRGVWEGSNWDRVVESVGLVLGGGTMFLLLLVQEPQH